MSAAMASDSSAEGDVRPVVATGNSGRLSLIVFFVLLGLGGLWIVSLMADQREAMQASGIGAADDPTARISSPPPLSLPRDFAQAELGPRAALVPAINPDRSPRIVQVPVTAVQPTRSGTTLTNPSSETFLLPARPDPPVIFSDPSPSISLSDAAETETDATRRITADRFVKPALTIPQGTVIPAVLETALDSTRPGGVRALVQRDIHSFDGSRVLIHRGSRLYGEYDAQLQRGQNRALIRWTRLIRPDGVTIALDSPASDPLGRAGVKGKVDGKFFQRFGGALLQSVLDVGVGVATREATDGVIVALPGSTQNVGPQVSQGEITPTLKVRHGTSVSVFVAHDLDFSSVDS